MSPGLSIWHGRIIEYMRPELNSLDQTPQNPAMSTDLMRELFEHEFTDAQGRTWRTEIQDNDDAPFIANKTSCELSGRIYCDGKYAGSFARSVTFYEDGRRLAVHKEMGLHDEPGRRYQRQGFATEFNRLCALKYVEAGIDRVTLNTGIDGLATWPKRGFDLAASKTHRTLDDSSTVPAAFADSDYARAMQYPLTRIKENIEDLPETERAAAMAHFEAVKDLDLQAIVESDPEWARTVMHAVKIRLYAAPQDLISPSIQISE